MTDCLFCRILRNEIPAKKIYEDEHTFAFEDINPQAPTHVLIIPKRHVRGLKEATAEDAELIGYCQLVAARIARRFLAASADVIAGLERRKARAEPRSGPRKRIRRAGGSASGADVSARR